jgi:hypothetical protein
MKKICFLLLIILLSACDGDIMQPESQQIVVEGWIEDGGHPVVILSFTIPISEEYAPVDSIEQYLIRWGRVSVSDGEKTVILSGKYDKGYFPPYIYTSTSIMGQAGKTYTVRVDYRDFHATAQTTIPESVPIDRLYTVPVGSSDTLRTVHAVFKPTAGSHQYFKLFTRSEMSDQQYLSSWLGILDASTLANPADVPVYRGMKVTNQEDYDPHYVVGDTVIVKLCTLDKQSYHYWKDWGDAEEFSANPLFNVMYNPRSNIQGGVGYWCGYGKSQKVIIVK